jgi:hypothetical protein
VEPTTALVFSAVSGALAAAAGLYAASTKRQAQAMLDTPTTAAGQIQAAGYYEVEGRVRCSSPLSAPRDGRPCVYFHHHAEEQRQVQRRNSKGRTVTRYEWTTVIRDTQSCPFEIEDMSGRLRIQPQEAQLEGTRSSGRTENPAYGPRTLLGGDDRLGWRESITAIYVDDRIYAIGQVEQHPEGPTMDRPGPDSEPFLVSVRSEDELVESAQTSFNVAVVACVLLGGASLVLLLMGLTAR